MIQTVRMVREGVSSKCSDSEGNSDKENSSGREKSFELQIIVMA
jgi:hypothetical protein